MVSSKPRCSWRTRLHRYLDRVDRRFGAALRATPALESMWVDILDRAVAAQSDRRYMREKILPAIALSARSRLLFVGVRG